MSRSPGLRARPPVRLTLLVGVLIATFLLGMALLGQVIERAEGVHGERRCDHLAPNGVDSPERGACLRAEASRTGVHWLELVAGPATTLVLFGVMAGAMVIGARPPRSGQARP